MYDSWPNCGAMCGVGDSVRNNSCLDLPTQSLQTSASSSLSVFCDPHVLDGAL